VPFTVTVSLSGEAGAEKLELLGCRSNCAESSPLAPILQLNAVRRAQGHLEVDSSEFDPLIRSYPNDFDEKIIGVTLPEYELLQGRISDPFWEAQNPNEDPWLIFDMFLDVIPKGITLNPGAGFATIQVRWVLRTMPDSTGFSVTDDLYPSLAYDKTRRTPVPKLLHWNFPHHGPVKIFIKGADTFRHKRAFEVTTRRLNQLGRKVYGGDFFRIEFIEAGSALDREIIAGDPRFNVFQLDDRNNRGCAASPRGEQMTGQILQAVGFCGKTRWFTQSESDVGDAHRFWIENFGPQSGKIPRTVKPRPGFFEDNLQFPQNDFNQVFFENYITHEMTHFLGIQHNLLGSVFGSSLDFFGRISSQPNKPGRYDVMALKYSILGIKPKFPEWGCLPAELDESSDAFNPECAGFDETRDPFSFLLRQVTKNLNWLTMPGTSFEPSWTFEIAQTSAAKRFLEGALQYGVVKETAFKKMRTFTRFAGRPKSFENVEPYVQSAIRKIYCDPKWDIAVQEKQSPEAVARAQENLAKARHYVIEAATKLKYSSPSGFACQ
jgi:hypothetical protein